MTKSEMSLVVLALSVGGGAFVAGAAQAGDPKSAGIPESKDPALAKLHTEAKTNLRSISDGAQAYFDSEHASTAGEILPHQFPISTGLAPAGSCCNGPKKVCANDVPWWKVKTWEVLNFEPSGRPLHYRYEFTSSGTDAKATYTARAIGDPQCNGHEEVWEVAGKIKAGKVKSDADGDTNVVSVYPEGVRRVK